MFFLTGVIKTDEPQTRPSEAKGPKKRRWISILAILVATAVVVAFAGLLWNALRGPTPAVPATVSTTVVQETTQTTVPITASPATVAPEPAPATVSPTTTVPVTAVGVPTTEAVEAESISCEILPENLCSQGVLVEWTNDMFTPEGGLAPFTVPALAFELPPGTPLSAPVDGEAFYQARTENTPSRLEFEEYEVAFTALFIRNLESPEIGNWWEPVREEEVLGFVSQFSATGGKGEVDPPGDYNLIVYPRLSRERLGEFIEFDDKGNITRLDIPDFERQLELNRWFWEGWFGMEAQPLAIEP